MPPFKAVEPEPATVRDEPATEGRIEMLLPAPAVIVAAPVNVRLDVLIAALYEPEVDEMEPTVKELPPTR